MSPRILPLVLFFISSVLSSKAQDQDKFVPFAKNFYSLSNQNNLNQVFRKGSSFAGNILNNNHLQVNCFCSVYPEIVPSTRQGTLYTFQGIPHASCSQTSITFSRVAFGANAATQNIDSTCGVTNVTYAWSIVVGNSIAAISGSNTGPTVNVAISGSGSFTLKLENTVTCSDGSTCTNSTTHSETVTFQKCQCQTAPVTITPTNKEGTTWTYSGTSPGTCLGQWGIPPSLQNCAVQNVIYLWSITGNGVASIAGATDQPTVNVKITGNGSFTLQLNITTVCSDGQRCENYNSIQEVANVPSPKSCSCDAGVKCQRMTDVGGLRKYEGVLKGGCTGEYGPSPPYNPCGINKVTWHWQINSGSSVVEFVGPIDQPSVSVRVKGTGKYELEVQIEVECSDGTKECGPGNYSICTDSADINKKCSFLYTESNQPKMAGGLSNQVQRKQKIRRDEFIALIAEGKDYDKVTIECTPSYECDNSQKKNAKEVLLAGKVRFEWEIEQGDGNFVKLGILPKDVKKGAGDRVIFQPPYVPLPKDGNQNSKTTIILLRVIDETGTGALLDQTITAGITITTKRSKGNNEDYYEVEVNSPDWNPPSPSLQENNDGLCKAAFGWEKDHDLKTPGIQLASVPDNNKMVLGQWMVLEANNQNETDKLKMICEATYCGTDGGEKEYHDDIEWEWSIKNDDGKKGRFVGGNKGRFVIYEAPMTMPANVTDLTVDIEVMVQNTGVQINDVPFTSTPVTFKVYQPGVQLEYPPLDWLPEAFGRHPFVRLKSYLLHKENGIWKEALAHMGRIHFFELLDVSQEKGISMNFPTPDHADNCRDLNFEKDEDHTEVFERPNDPVRFNCSIKYPVHARSEKPIKDDTIAVISSDQGAYGFLRSFANINKGGRDSIKGETPVYVPVPIPPEKVRHPSGRPKKNIYTDNRVSVPRDVDENHIADGGWRTRGNVLIKDPANPQDDDDNQLPGDGYPGDGLSNYEEYRGFSVKGFFIRTNIRNKDLFIYNPNGFNLGIFEAALSQGAGKSSVGVDVHEIDYSDYVDNDTREINFNYNPRLHYVPPLSDSLRIQKGLWLADLKDFQPRVLGQTFPADTARFKNINTPPNWVRGVGIFTKNIRKYAPRVRVSAEGLITHVVTHELGHGIAMWHHGDSLHVLHGLQSGNVNCIMRYDNILPDNIGEAFGVLFCNDPRGTGYNTEVPAFKCEPTECYGNATRGDCIHQFRISCRTIDIPKR